MAVTMRFNPLLVMDTQPQAAAARRLLCASCLQR